MTVADITGYNVGIFIHVLAVVVGLGTTFGYAVFMEFAARSAPQSMPAIYRAAQISDRYVVTPALLVILLAGIYLLAEGSISVSESWVSVGLVAVIVLFGMIHGYFAPRYRKGIELAERDLRGGGKLSEDSQAIGRQMAIGGQLTGLVIVVTIFFMVVKP